MSNANHSVLQISFQQWIDSMPEEKALHTCAIDKVAHGQSANHNGTIVEANSDVVDLAAF